MLEPNQLIPTLQPAAQQQGTYALTVARHNCLGAEGKHMAGGACSAALLQALQEFTGQPLIAAHTQFLGTPTPGETVTIRCSVRKRGRTICQAHAGLYRDDQQLSVCAATLGARSGHNTGSDRAWPEPPSVTAAADCPRLPFIRQDSEDQHAYLDIRLAEVQPAAGRALFWVRTGAVEPANRTAFLALIADYLPEALQLVLQRPLGASSLDNQLRVLRHSFSEWLLCDIQLHAMAHGVFHGAMFLWSQEGVLLANASQSGVPLALEEQAA